MSLHVERMGPRAEEIPPQLLIRNVPKAILYASSEVGSRVESDDDSESNPMSSIDEVTTTPRLFEKSAPPFKLYFK
jgi:hypothetical protein